MKVLDYRDIKMIPVLTVLIQNTPIPAPAVDNLDTPGHPPKAVCEGMGMHLPIIDTAAASTFINNKM